MQNKNSIMLKQQDHIWQYQNKCLILIFISPFFVLMIVLFSEKKFNITAILLPFKKSEIATTKKDSAERTRKGSVEF